MAFKLDARLTNDCFILAETPSSLWLLLNNRYFPWFILVPKTELEELYLLPPDLQQQVHQQSTLLCEFVTTSFLCDKLNVAAIGNIVKQMHIHIIARTENDACWPGVVWGTAFQEKYEADEVLIIQHKLQQFCQLKNINDVEFARVQ